MCLQDAAVSRAAISKVSSGSFPASGLRVGYNPSRIALYCTQIGGTPVNAFLTAVDLSAGKMLLVGDTNKGGTLALTVQTHPWLVSQELYLLTAAADVYVITEVILSAHDDKLVQELM